MKKNNNIHTPRKIYVAYGSNLHLEQMSYRCPDAEILGSGIIENYRLAFKGNARGFGVADVEPACPPYEKSGDYVPVGLFLISDADEYNLDCYEGYPRLYTKKWLRIRLEGGAAVGGMVYVMTPGHSVTAPSDYYYDVIRQGYEDFGFTDADVLRLEAARAEAEKAGREYARAKERLESLGWLPETKKA